MGNPILKSNALKNTKSRTAVLRILEEHAAPMTAEEVHALAAAMAELSLSTTYRTLATLSDKGIVLRNLSQDGKYYYQLNSHQHRHHLICTRCGTLIPIDGCPLDELERHLCEKTGFKITGHNLEFLGLCPKCANQKQ